MPSLGRSPLNACCHPSQQFMNGGTLKLMVLEQMVAFHKVQRSPLCTSPSAPHSE